jgi:hemoglobin-like flavoprotein
MSNTPARDSSNLDVNLLLSSFTKIEPQASAFAATFYQILFTKYPQIRPLFSATDMEKQQNKLIEALKLVMVNVHKPDTLTTILKNLGKRHVGYGAVLTDYPLIGDALLQALAQHLGKDWNAEVQQAWTLAYGMIADTMAAGAIEVTFDSEPISGSDELPISLPYHPEADVANHPTKNRQTGFPGGLTMTQLIILTSLGLTALCGYVGWHLMQSQANSIERTSEAQPK